MGLSLTLQMPDIAAIASHLDPTDDVMKAWGDDAQTLLQQEIANVTKRTQERTSGPYSTGALAASVTGQAYNSAKNGTLISVWFNSAQQYSAWNRYYAPYQEGKPLGLDTYTNGMHHMLYDSQTEDAQQIEQWATQAAETGIGAWGSILAGDGAEVS